MKRYLIVCGFFAFVIACTQNMTKQYLTNIDLDPSLTIPSSFDNSTTPCRVKEHYMPDTNNLDHTPIKYIRVNFHFMNGDNGTANFDERTGPPYIKEVMRVANNKLERNKKMRLPLGNKTPVIPMRYQYVLTGRDNDPKDDGIYFHYDDELYGMINHGKGKNIFDKKVYQKYGIMKDTVMNVFVMPYPEDSLKSKTFKKFDNGVAFGQWVKVCGWHYRATKDTIWQANGKYKVPYGKWYAMKLLNHEIGHNLGLRHTWRSNDGCDDTPHNPNCFGKGKRPPCDTQWGNNIMDYNTHASAWSPCQIATAHWNMSAGKKPKLRNLLVPTWCEFKREAMVNVRGDVVWNGAKDLESHIVIRNGGTLTVRCKVSLPKGAKVIVHPKGKLVLEGGTLYNDCGEEWDGIEILSSKKHTGEVVYGPGAEILNVVNEVKVSVGND